MYDVLPITPLISMSRHDPYPAYEKMRQKGPIFRSPMNGVHLVTGLKEAQQALKDPKLGRGHLMYSTLMAHKHGTAAWGLYKATMLFADPPHHGRLRAFMSRAFQPKILESMRASVEEIVDGLLAKMKKKKKIDAVSELSLPMPVEVIAKMIGVPRPDWERCIAWSKALAPMIDAVLPHDMVGNAINVGFEFGDYVRGLIEEKRRAPQNDILTALVRGLDEDDALTLDELVSNVIVLFTAGHETTMNLIANTFVLLAQHEDARGLFDSDPQKHLAGLIEESLRYEPPVQLSVRIGAEPTEIGGMPIQPGEAVWIFIGAVNRDPERFEDPQRFNIERDPNPHMSFGSGIHYCLGAALARLEAEIALSRFFAMFPGWSLAKQELVLRETTTLRGYQRVELNLR